MSRRAGSTSAVVAPAPLIGDTHIHTDVRSCRVDGRSLRRVAEWITAELLPASTRIDDSIRRWCFEHGLTPLDAQRGHVELY
jgi:hypothetical protein